jgi:hypothetical protein
LRRTKTLKSNRIGFTRLGLCAFGRNSALFGNRTRSPTTLGKQTPRMDNAGEWSDGAAPTGAANAWDTHERLFSRA